MTTPELLVIEQTHEVSRLNLAGILAQARDYRRQPWQARQNFYRLWVRQFAAAGMAADEYESAVSELAANLGV